MPGPVRCLSRADDLRRTSLRTPSSVHDAIHIAKASYSENTSPVSFRNSMRGAKRQHESGTDGARRACDECDKDYGGGPKSAASSLSRHKRNKHGADKDKTWPCRHCGTPLRRKDNCKVHMQDCPALKHSCGSFGTNWMSSPRGTAERWPDARRNCPSQSSASLTRTASTDPSALAGSSDHAAGVLESSAYARNASRSAPYPGPPPFFSADTDSVNALAGAGPSSHPTPGHLYSNSSREDARNAIADTTRADYALDSDQGLLGTVQAVASSDPGSGSPRDHWRLPPPRRQRYSLASNNTTLVDRGSAGGSPGGSDGAAPSPATEPRWA